MSEASSSSTKSASGRALGGDDLVAKLHKRANVAPNVPFSLTAHLSAGRVLVALRDALLAGGELSRRSKLMLICTGISLRRRHAASEVIVEADGPSTDAAVLQDQETSRALLLETAQLIFSLLCMIERRERGDDAGSAREAVKCVNAQCLWDVLKPPVRKRPREEEEGHVEEEEGEEGHGEEGESRNGDSWAEVMRISTAEIAEHALRIGAATLADKQPEDVALMSLYFRSAAASMAEAMLLKSHTDFVSLGLNHGDMTVSREKKLLAVAQAAESEMGQSILRDLVLSFLLPASVIGVRRGLLLSRAASTEAGVDHPVAVARRVRPWPAPSASGPTARTSWSGCAACSRAWPSSRPRAATIRSASSRPLAGASRCPSWRPPGWGRRGCGWRCCPTRGGGSCTGSGPTGHPRCARSQTFTGCVSRCWR